MSSNQPDSPSASTSSLLPHATTPTSTNAAPFLPFTKLNFIVTGCASVVGRAVCHELGRLGAGLALTDASKQAGQALCAELQQAGYRGSLLFSSFDPKDAERLTAFVKQVTKSLSSLSGLVNCAVYSPEDLPMHRIKLSTMTDMQDRNFKAVWTAMQAAITQFENQNDVRLQHPEGGYTIVNITSSFDTNEHCSAYQAARHAIMGLTRSAAVEYAYADIRINTVSAGAIEEENAGMSLMNQIFTNVGQIKAKVPMRRCARPEEIAKAVTFLLGPNSSYITGVDLPVDGGVRAKRD